MAVSALSLFLFAESPDLAKNVAQRDHDGILLTFGQINKGELGAHLLAGPDGDFALGSVGSGLIFFHQLKPRPANEKRPHGFIVFGNYNPCAVEAVVRKQRAAKTHKWPVRCSPDPRHFGQVIDACRL